jgi:hypothetical protein
VIVLGDSENEAVEFTQFLFPALCSLTFSGRRALLTEKMHGVVEQVENLDLDVLPFAGDSGNPLGRMLGKTANTRAADDDGNLQLAHGYHFLMGLGGG